MRGDGWMMFFDPSMCEVIRITQKRNPNLATYNIHNHDLIFVRNGGCLGDNISEKLNLNDLVDAAATAKKANNFLSFPRRNPVRIKAQCYQTLVRVILEYASSALINQLEAVQRRAARFVKGDYVQNY